MKEYAQIHWVGDAKEVLSAFPQEVKGVFEYSLRRLQRGLLPDCDARRMESVGKGVWELKTADERTWYRVIYLTRIGDAHYVLHAFEKSSLSLVISGTAERPNMYMKPSRRHGIASPESHAFE